MSTQSLDLTVVGWIGTDVRIFHETDGGVPYASFRVGSTRRWFDRQAGEWRDAQTEWFQCKAWRTLAVNAARSLRKGDPVIVRGQLSTEEWAAQDGPRTTLVLDVSALGPNLSFGTSHFARSIRPDASADGVPTDVSDLEELPEDDQEDAGPPAVDEADEDLAAGLALAGAR